MQIVILSVCLCTQGIQEPAMFRGGVWLPRLGGTITDGGGAIDFETNIDLRDQETVPLIEFKIEPIEDVVMGFSFFDFSTSGKTFLDVLEKAGFCKNVEKFTTDESGRINLEPTYHEDIAIFGYPGKKSGMEIEDLKKVHFEKLNAFTIFMLHTTIKDVVGTIPMDSIEKEKLN